jgi:hypothetical protein
LALGQDLAPDRNPELAGLEAALEGQLILGHGNEQRLASERAVQAVGHSGHRISPENQRRLMRDAQESIMVVVRQVNAKGA